MPVATHFGPEAIADILSACQSRSRDIAEVLSRALETPLEVSVGLGTTWDEQNLPEGFDGPGLALAFTVGQSALLAVLPEAPDVLPDWYALDDQAAQQQMHNLAQELSQQILPASMPVTAVRGWRTKSIATEIANASPAATATRVPMVLRTGQERRATLNLLWPLRAPEAFLGTGSPSTQSSGTDTRGDSQAGTIRQPTVQELPSYTKSLLRVTVPVSVSLAAKKKRLGEILELGVGSIIHFDKSCDDLLELEVNGHAIAQGEAVKVGDKFGLRVHCVILPEERFKPLRPPGNS